MSSSQSKIQNHNLQFKIHNLQFTIQALKSKIQDQLSTINNPQLAIHLSQFNSLLYSQPPPSLSSSAWWQPWASPHPSSAVLFSSTTPNGFQRNKSFATVPVLHQKFASTMASMALRWGKVVIDVGIKGSAIAIRTAMGYHTIGKACP